MNDPPLRPWVAIAKDGQILCCHCTCMAGLGETCSHSAASLFALETLIRMKTATPCTSLPCQWLKPSASHIEYAEGCNIDFARPAQKRKSEVSTPEESAARKLLNVPPPTEEQKAAFYKALSECGGRLAILSIVPDYADNFEPRAVKRKLPVPLSQLYDSGNMKLSLDELALKCRSELEKLHSITRKQISAVEEESWGQATSTTWFQQRAGRITASNFKATTRTNVSKPSKSLIKRICYPELCRFSTAATRWGCDHESDLRKRYGMIMTQRHTGLNVDETGFHMSADRPYFGASPDGLLSCDCCGKGCLEIKCPFCIKDKGVEEVAGESKAVCLEQKSNGNCVLRGDHQYYYQVQSQLYCTGRKYCDFVVWKENLLFIQRIIPDDSFLANELAKMDNFYLRCIMPELLAKVYTVEQSVATTASASEEFVCYCRNPPTEDMLVCKSKNCSIKAFHMKCLGIKRVPQRWFCPNCKKLEVKQKKLFL
ncbi:uncharacterized protein LOC133631368 isoform X2 [Entelurus aequoreus]|nr:uncharacterized protein LOC133631368 isoform X2 [Entelurus aequoreus]XP_061879549.1 uncharacterized protein LOC133631368 isoform X2 [Entelurus aequoreus]XP_061879550.1 uncharacterized protein LOC133631368 isoform X2 [Entelurus aequoreus]